MRESKLPESLELHPRSASRSNRAAMMRRPTMRELPLPEPLVNNELKREPSELHPRSASRSSRAAMMRRPTMRKSTLPEAVVDDNVAALLERKEGKTGRRSPCSRRRHDRSPWHSPSLSSIVDERGKSCQRLRTCQWSMRSVSGKPIQRNRALLLTSTALLPHETLRSP